MAIGPTVGQYSFDGWELPTKYEWMHSGAGAQAAAEAQDAIRDMADRIAASGERVRGLLTGAEWMGAAAEAAGQAMRRGAGQLGQTAAGAATAERCITELGESFEAAQRRVPSPNEIPTGLGDAFLFGAAEGFNALSPFDVQSPLHEAMEQRRELDRQANQALTDHMTTSRDRVEAMPVVTAPAPMTVAAQSAGTAGVGGVGQPAWATSGATGASASAITSTPVSTSAALANTTPVPSPAPSPAAPSPAPAGPAGTGGEGGPFPPVAPASTGPAQTATSGNARPRLVGPATTGATAAESGLGGATFGPHSGGRTGAGAAAARRVGFGARPGAGGEGMTGRGAPGAGGPAGGPASGTTATGRGAGTGGLGAGGARGQGAGSFLYPPVGGRGSSNGTEHNDRYAQHTDHIVVGELPLVAPAVIGETPEEEDRRLRRNRDGR